MTRALVVVFSLSMVALGTDVLAAGLPGAGAGSPAKPSAAGSTGAAGSAEAPVPTPDDGSALEARINSLQDAKTCVVNAKTRADVANCQKAMRIDSKRKIEVHGY